jgi:hypothetical protein
MGASSWVYFAPYDPDFNEALWRLRRVTFIKGDYSGPRFMSGTEAADLTDTEVQAAAAAFLGIEARDLVALDPLARERPGPRDELDRRINRVLHLTLDRGTHSILDMTHVADRPGLAVVAPLSSSDLTRVLGTSRPTKALIAAAVRPLAELRGRWQGSLAVVHDATSRPVELCFLGRSGD